ncbi:MAG: HD domain-containing phosphohydrolase [Chloroflexota bacterium]
MLKLPTDVLQPGMVLAKPVIDERGFILLRQGVPLTPDYILNLKRRGFSSVYISEGDTDDIVVEDIISDQLRYSTQATLARVFDFSQQISADLATTADNHALVEVMSDRSVVNALRSHDGFLDLENSVTSILDELVETDMLTGMSQIRSHDDLTFGHSVNVTVTALMIGKRLYLNRPDLMRLGAGCMLHDIGKIFVTPSASQNGQDSAAPQIGKRYLREHPRLGYELLRARNPEAVMTNHVILEHHERQDGRGYPRGLHGTNRIDRSRSDRQNILLIAEIAAVADVYDILSVDQQERPALPPKQIADTMRRLAGSFLNREIVELFLSMLPTLPTGIDIIVRTGRYAGYKGIVAQADPKQPDRPLIRLLYTPRGDRIVPIELDLARDKSTVVEAML